MSKRARSKYSIGVSQDPLFYNCTFCTYKTRSETGMRMHTKATHKEKAIIDKKNIIDLCEFCGMSFKNIKEITNHIKQNHRQT